MVELSSYQFFLYYLRFDATMGLISSINVPTLHLIKPHLKDIPTSECPRDGAKDCK